MDLLCLLNMAILIKVLFLLFTIFFSGCFFRQVAGPGLLDTLESGLWPRTPVTVAHVQKLSIIEYLCDQAQADPEETKKLHKEIAQIPMVSTSELCAEGKSYPECPFQ